MADHISIDDSLEGKRAVTAGGHEIGTVSDVRSETIYVAIDPHVSQRLLAKLGWDAVNGEDYPVPKDVVRRVTDDEIHLHLL